MKKLILVILFHFILGLIFQSCCPKSESNITHSSRIGVRGDIKLTTIQPRTKESVDTVRGIFYIEQIYGYQSAGNYQPEGNIMNTAYAFQCPDPIFINNVLEDQLELKFDKAVEFLGDTIPANINLFDFQSVVDHTILENYVQDNYGTPSLEIHFDSLFHADAILPSGELNIRLTAYTTDENRIIGAFTTFLDL